VAISVAPTGGVGNNGPKQTPEQPKARLSWSVIPERYQRRVDHRAYLKASLNRPLERDVLIHYRFGGEAREMVDYVPPVERTIIIPAGQREGHQQVFTIKANPIVGEPDKDLVLEVEAIEPMNLDRPDALRIALADDEPLPGRSLILLILTDGLAQDGQNTLRELGLLAEKHVSEFVGETAYLLAGDGRIYRWDARTRSVAGWTPFKSEVAPTKILTLAYDSIGRQFGGRIQSGDQQILLVWNELFGRRAESIEGGFNKPPDQRYHLFWVGPRDSLARSLEGCFSAVAGMDRFHVCSTSGGRTILEQIENVITGR
jgi:hypothetical protein